MFCKFVLYLIFSFFYCIFVRQFFVVFSFSIDLKLQNNF